MVSTTRLGELQAWEEELKAEQDRIRHEIEPLLAEQEQLSARLDLVQRLLSLERASRADGPTDRPGTNLPAGSSSSALIQTNVKTILEERRAPMHISEIRTALIERGVPIPGKGTDANVIVHLRRAPELFIKRARGTYDLKRRPGRRRNEKK